MCTLLGGVRKRSLGEVEKHWEERGDGEMKGSIAELVWLQSWGGRKGDYEGYWVVVKGKDSKSGLKEESKGEEKAVEVGVEKEVIEEGAKGASPTKETPTEDMPKEDAPAEEMQTEETPAGETAVLEEAPGSEEEQTIEEEVVEDIPKGVGEKG